MKVMKRPMRIPTRPLEDIRIGFTVDVLVERIRFFSDVFCVSSVPLAFSVGGSVFASSLLRVAVASFWMKLEEGAPAASAVKPRGGDPVAAPTAEGFNMSCLEVGTLPYSTVSRSGSAPPVFFPDTWGELQTACLKRRHQWLNHNEIHPSAEAARTAMLEHAGGEAKVRIEGIRPGEVPSDEEQLVRQIEEGEKNLYLSLVRIVEPRHLACITSKHFEASFGLGFLGPTPVGEETRAMFLGEVTGIVRLMRKEEVDRRMALHEQFAPPEKPTAVSPQGRYAGGAAAAAGAAPAGGTGPVPVPKSPPSLLTPFTPLAPGMCIGLRLWLLADRGPEGWLVLDASTKGNELAFANHYRIPPTLRQLVETPPGSPMRLAASFYVAQIAPPSADSAGGLSPAPSASSSSASGGTASLRPALFSVNKVHLENLPLSQMPKRVAEAQAAEKDVLKECGENSSGSGGLVLPSTFLRCLVEVEPEEVSFYRPPGETKGEEQRQPRKPKILYAVVFVKGWPRLCAFAKAGEKIRAWDELTFDAGPVRERQLAWEGSVRFLEAMKGELFPDYSSSSELTDPPAPPPSELSESGFEVKAVPSLSDSVSRHTGQGIAVLSTQRECLRAVTRRVRDWAAERPHETALALKESSEALRLSPGAPKKTFLEAALKALDRPPLPPLPPTPPSHTFGMPAGAFPDPTHTARSVDPLPHIAPFPPDAHRLLPAGMENGGISRVYPPQGGGITQPPRGAPAPPGAGVPGPAWGPPMGSPEMPDATHAWATVDVHPPRPNTIPRPPPRPAMSPRGGIARTQAQAGKGSIDNRRKLPPAGAKGMRRDGNEDYPTLPPGPGGPSQMHLFGPPGSLPPHVSVGPGGSQVAMSPPPHGPHGFPPTRAFHHHPNLMYPPAHHPHPGMSPHDLSVSLVPFDGPQPPAMSQAGTGPPPNPHGGFALPPFAMQGPGGAMVRPPFPASHPSPGYPPVPLQAVHVATYNSHASFAQSPPFASPQQQQQQTQQRANGVRPPALTSATSTPAAGRTGPGGLLRDDESLSLFGQPFGTPKGDLPSPDVSPGRASLLGFSHKQAQQLAGAPLSTGGGTATVSHRERAGMRSRADSERKRREEVEALRKSLIASVVASGADLMLTDYEEREGGADGGDVSMGVEGTEKEEGEKERKRIEARKEALEKLLTCPLADEVLQEHGERFGVSEWHSLPNPELLRAWKTAMEIVARSDPERREGRRRERSPFFPYRDRDRDGSPAAASAVGGEVGWSVPGPPACSSFEGNAFVYLKGPDIRVEEEDSEMGFEGGDEGEAGMGGDGYGMYGEGGMDRMNNRASDGGKRSRPPKPFCSLLEDPLSFPLPPFDPVDETELLPPAPPNKKKKIRDRNTNSLLCELNGEGGGYETPGSDGPDVAYGVEYEMCEQRNLLFKAAVEAGLTMDPRKNSSNQGNLGGNGNSLPLPLGARPRTEAEMADSDFDDPFVAIEKAGPIEFWSQWARVGGKVPRVLLAHEPAGKKVLRQSPAAGSSVFPQQQSVSSFPFAPADAWGQGGERKTCECEPTEAALQEMLARAKASRGRPRRDGLPTGFCPSVNCPLIQIARERGMVTEPRSPLPQASPLRSPRGLNAAPMLQTPTGPRVPPGQSPSPETTYPPLRPLRILSDVIAYGKEFPTRSVWVSGQKREILDVRDAQIPGQEAITEPFPLDANNRVWGELLWEGPVQTSVMKELVEKVTLLIPGLVFDFNTLSWTLKRDLAQHYFKKGWRGPTSFGIRRHGFKRARRRAFRALLARLSGRTGGEVHSGDEHEPAELATRLPMCKQYKPHFEIASELPTGRGEGEWLALKFKDPVEKMARKAIRRIGIKVLSYFDQILEPHKSHQKLPIEILRMLLFNLPEFQGIRCDWSTYSFCVSALRTKNEAKSFSIQNLGLLPAWKEAVRHRIALLQQSLRDHSRQKRIIQTMGAANRAASAAAAAAAGGFAGGGGGGVHVSRAVGGVGPRRLSSTSLNQRGSGAYSREASSSGLADYAQYEQEDSDSQEKGQGGLKGKGKKEAVGGGNRDRDRGGGTKKQGGSSAAPSRGGVVKQGSRGLAGGVSGGGGVKKGAISSSAGSREKGQALGRSGEKTREKSGPKEKKGGLTVQRTASGAGSTGKDKKRGREESADKPEKEKTKQSSDKKVKTEEKEKKAESDLEPSSDDDDEDGDDEGDGETVQKRGPGRPRGSVMTEERREQKRKEREREMKQPPSPGPSGVYTRSHRQIKLNPRYHEPEDSAAGWEPRSIVPSTLARGTALARTVTEESGAGPDTGDVAASSSSSAAAAAASLTSPTRTRPKPLAKSGSPPKHPMQSLVPPAAGSVVSRVQSSSNQQAPKSVGTGRPKGRPRKHPRPEGDGQAGGEHGDGQQGASSAVSPSHQSPPASAPESVAGSAAGHDEAPLSPPVPAASAPVAAEMGPGGEGEGEESAVQAGGGADATATAASQDSKPQR
uniref:Uncharacterized protein n=1 Tax=Chromera velia CCMP2878 TaxID=1169474 RepID=A0A0G4F1N4_9ALVE|eukprot:Cvel_14677.t1-p1 / transcript=Cvel_14677.t1 / gene=Cvel_14677 / organism=Chromera_velia_CCMP2878 / gene_product=hypothetical protein / transcript_product=hypothetical protein / location=Cvel_scaffold1052:39525-51496(-) / protein_length=2464 / sequence_SO=supercontig / SO=protein_coding / is_pseudo=false